MGFGFNFLQELTRAGYIPKKKCAPVVSHPTYVSTTVFAREMGLTLCYVRKLCVEGKISCLDVGPKKFLINWEEAQQDLKDLQQIPRKPIHNAVNVVNHNNKTVEKPRKRKRASPVVTDDALAVKRALKQEAYV